MTTLDLTEAVRRRTDLFFGSRGPSMPQLIAMVLEDVCRHSEARAEVLLLRDVALVTSTMDWMATDKHVEALFEGPVPVRGLPNTFRAEFVLTCVCSGVLTIGAAGAYAKNLSLSDLPGDDAARAAKAARAFAWRFVG